MWLTGNRPSNQTTPAIMRRIEIVRIDGITLALLAYTSPPPPHIECNSFWSNSHLFQFFSNSPCSIVALYYYFLCVCMIRFIWNVFDRWHRITFNNFIRYWMMSFFVCTAFSAILFSLQNIRVWCVWTSTMRTDKLCSTYRYDTATISLIEHIFVEFRACVCMHVPYEILLYCVRSEYGSISCEFYAKFPSLKCVWTREKSLLLSLNFCPDSDGQTQIPWQRLSHTHIHFVRAIGDNLKTFVIQILFFFSSFCARWNGQKITFFFSGMHFNISRRSCEHECALMCWYLLHCSEVNLLMCKFMLHDFYATRMCHANPHSTHTHTPSLPRNNTKTRMHAGIISNEWTSDVLEHKRRKIQTSGYGRKVVYIINE